MKVLLAKLQNILLLLICFAYFLVRGKADRVPSLPKSILIVQTAKMGDAVCTTPMFSAVKHKYPGVKVVVYGDSINKQVLEYHPDVDDFIVETKNFWQTVKLFRQRKFDFSCTATPSLIVLAMLYLSGIPSICTPKTIGHFCPYYSRLYRWLMPLVLTRTHNVLGYTPREYLRVLEPLGIKTDDTTKTLSFSNNASGSVDNFFSRNGIDSENDMIIGISPSAGNKIKRWPAERFAQVAEYLRDKYGARVVVVGGKMDTKEVEGMFGFIKNKKDIINTLNQFSIDELKAFISRIHLFVSVDTGPIYIAEAFGVPTVDIVGPMDENNQPPRGLLYKVVVANRERPQMWAMNARRYDTKEALRQVNDISADMVIQTIDELEPLIKKRYSIK